MPGKINKPTAIANAARQSKNAKNLLSFMFGQADGYSIFRIVSLLILLGWTADTLLEGYIHLRELAWQHYPLWGWVMATGPILLFALWLMGLRRHARQKLEKATLQAESHPVRPRRTLVLLLSVHRNPKAPHDELAADFSNWRIPLEAIKSHTRKNRLKEVWLVGSSGGSHYQIPDFRKLVHSQISSGDRLKLNSLADLGIERYANGVDFNDLASVVEVLELIRLSHESAHSVDELIVDITGGKTTTSAAAATVCQNRKVAFQYVQVEQNSSGGKEFPVEEYNLELVSADEPQSS